MREDLFHVPPVTPFVQCPNCKRLLEYEDKTSYCPACREEIDPQYALTSALAVVYQNQACSHANTIKTAEPAAVLICLASTVGFLMGMPSLMITSFATPMMALVAILLWYRRFGRFRLNDEEYLRTRRKILNSLKLWLALVAVQLLLLAYTVRTGW